MAYQDLTKDKLISRYQTNIDEALSKVADPTNEEKRQMVYQREPDTASQSFDGWPIIIVESYGYSSEQATVNESVTNFEANLELVVEGLDNTADSKANQDTVADRIVNTFLNTERVNLGEVKLARPRIVSDVRSTGVQESGKPLIRREIEINFQAQVTMS